MLHVGAQYFTYCSWVGGMTVRRHPFRSMTDNGESVLKKLLEIIQNRALILYPVQNAIYI